MQQQAISFNGNLVIQNKKQGNQYMIYNPEMKGGFEWSWIPTKSFFSYEIPYIDFNELVVEVQRSILIELGIEVAYLNRDFNN